MGGKRGRRSEICGPVVMGVVAVGGALGHGGGSGGIGSEEIRGFADGVRTGGGVGGGGDVGGGHGGRAGGFKIHQKFRQLFCLYGTESTLVADLGLIYDFWY